MCPPPQSFNFFQYRHFQFFFSKMSSTVIPATINSDSDENLAGGWHEFVGIWRNLAGFGFLFSSLFLIFLGPKLVGEE